MQTHDVLIKLDGNYVTKTSHVVGSKFHCELINTQRSNFHKKKISSCYDGRWLIFRPVSSVLRLASLELGQAEGCLSPLGKKVPTRGRGAARLKQEQAPWKSFVLFAKFDYYCRQPTKLLRIISACHGCKQSLMCLFKGLCRHQAAQRAIDWSTMDTYPLVADTLEYDPCPVVDETHDEEESGEEESATTDEELEPEIIIHDTTVIEIDDEDDSALSPQKPTIAKQESEAKHEPNSEVPKVPESSLQVAPGSAPPVEVGQEVEDIMDSEEEDKANDKSRPTCKGTFQVGCMGHR